MSIEFVGGEGMTKYTLYLDESTAVGGLEYFCLGGCIIEEDIYENKISKYVNRIKSEIFNDTNVILHEYEIRDASQEPYTILRDSVKRNKFWQMMHSVFQNNDVFVICAAIHKNYSDIYKSKDINNEYFIAMQVILENYAYFLDQTNAQGMVYVESKNAIDSERLTSHYHTIVANGTLFLTKVLFQKRLCGINFLVKGDNNIGLQLADFIPNAFNRLCTGKKEKRPSILEPIKNKLYDGGVQSIDRFGLKIIP